MSAYYNEFDPFAAAWLRELIKAGHIAPGDVDDRSIKDVKADDLRGYTQCHFFAGIGVWSHALRSAGWSDERPVWTGSCPCQPFSAAGKGGGFDDERHLWPDFFRLIAECRPDVVLGEQVASKDGLGWLDLVHADLEGADYAVGAVDTCAAGFGAPHIRQRLYWTGERLADTRGDGHERTGQLGEPAGRHGAAHGGADERMADTEGARRTNGSAIDGGRGSLHATPSEIVGTGDRVPSGPEWLGPTNGLWRDVDWLGCRDGKWRPVEPGTFPLAHGAPARVGRLRGYGNAIVAPQAQAFIKAVMSCV
jgi:DNA (cytosine-5)-methyltransferase 1